LIKSILEAAEPDSHLYFIGKQRLGKSLNGYEISQPRGVFYISSKIVFHDIKIEKRRLSEPYHPDLSRLRPVLFWDTRMESIDWARQKRAIIERVWERGTEQEKQEIVRFYGKGEVDTILDRKNIKK
jgi:hypothetical protein